MKFNWKIVVAIFILIGVTVWGFDSVRTRSYSGTELNFPIGGGPVTVNNMADEPITAQLVGTGTRSFSLINASMDATGSSVREGTGSRSTQTLELELPSGISEFTVARGKDVTFMTNTDAPLEATIQPLSAEDTQSTLMVVAVVILLTLFFISHTTQHMWFKRLRGDTTPAQVMEPAVNSPGTSQGTNLRSFGDNRAKTGD